MGAVYRHLKTEMKLLWTKDLRLNTVHVDDVARALWHIAATTTEKGGRSGAVTGKEIYNLCDKGNTGTVTEFLIVSQIIIDQGSINKFLESIFGIETGFQGTMISTFAKVKNS
jgi:nucleoside-diphosphate-sugar epimerase